MWSRHSCCRIIEVYSVADPRGSSIPPPPYPTLSKDSDFCNFIQVFRNFVKNEISKGWRPLKRPCILTLLELSFSSLKFVESMVHEIKIRTQSCTYARDRRFSSSLGAICPYCEASPRHEWKPAGPLH